MTQNSHEPLITEETGNRIREMKAKRIREPRYNAKRAYALSGVMKCGVCGAYIPLTRLNMASPTRFELVLPA
jgi:hypothetical protein